MFVKKNLIFFFILFFISFLVFNVDKKEEPLSISFYSWENSFNQKEIVNTKNKMSYQRINEELNIYYVAATRAQNTIEMADLNLKYTYNENDDSTAFVKSRFINKRADNKKSKELQEEWLKKNRVNKVNAF